MTDHDLGSRLREVVLAGRGPGEPPGAAALQALVPSLCSEEQACLIPALQHLLQRPGVVEALRTPAAGAGALDLLQAWHRELAEIFRPALCQRLGPVLQGLLGLRPLVPPPPPPAPLPAPPPPPAPPPARPPLAPASTLKGEAAAAVEELMRESMQRRTSGRSGSRGALVVLSFMAGLLVVGVFGAMAWMLSLSRRPQPAPPPPPPEQAAPPALPPAAPATAAAEPPPPTPEQEPDLRPTQADAEAGIGAVQAFYAAISSGDGDAARQRLSPAAAARLDPARFRPYRQVSVADLRETGRNGTSLTLSGVVTLVFADGTSQQEAHTFTVDTATQPALITGSSFGAVLKPRG